MAENRPATPTPATGGDIGTPRTLPRAIDGVVVIALTCLVTALDISWAAHNQAPPMSDDNSHLYTSVRMLHHLASSHAPLSLMVLYPGHYPPLTYQVTCLFYHLFGESTAVAVASLFPFLLTLSLSLYGIGATFGNRWSGLLCALAGLCAPVVLEHSRTYFLDLPATAALALSLCALLHSRGFSNRPWSLVFGLSMGLGMLTKWTHPALVLPFLLVALWTALAPLYAERWPGAVVALLMGGAVAAMARHVLATPSPIEGSDYVDGPPFRWSLWGLTAGVTAASLGLLRRATRTRPNLVPLANVLESFILSALVAWPWYYANGERVRDKIIYQTGVHVDFWQGVAAYVQDISVMVYGAPLLLALGLWVGLADARTRRRTVLLAVGIIVGVALNALLPPDSRYLMPVVVFVIPLALTWTATLPSQIPDGPKRRTARALCTGVGVIVALACLWQASASWWQEQGFGTPEGPRRKDTRNGIAHLGLMPVLADDPMPGHYPYEEVLETIQASDPSDHRWVAVLENRDDAASFQPRTFLYHAARRDLDLFLLETADDLEAGRDVRDIELVRTFLLIYRFDLERTRLLDAAARRHWLPAGAMPLKAFTFSPNVHVEVIARPRLRLNESPPEAGTR